MNLIIQPDEGITPVLAAIGRARKSIDIVVFRLNIKKVVAALGMAVGRGVAVQAIVAHTNKGGEKALRKLEKRLLDVGVTVSRTDDDLVRYHYKMLIEDRKVLHIMGFNFTSADVERSRSFGLSTKAPRLVREGVKLFQSDLDRQAYTSSSDRLIVSPDNARERLSALIRGAKKQLFIYDPDVSDPRMVRLIADRVKAGVDVRVIGHAGKRSGVEPQAYPGKHLHVRAIIRDRRKAFIGSQSLRTLELDRRREVGLIVNERAVVRRLVDVFEADWALTPAGKAASHAAEASADCGNKGSAVA